MVRLYELKEGLWDLYSQFDQAVADGEDTRWCDECVSLLGERLEEKAESLTRLIKQLKSDSDQLSAAARELQNKARARKNHAERLKQYLVDVITHLPPTKTGKPRVFKGELFKVSLNRSRTMFDSEKVCLDPLSAFVERKLVARVADATAHLKETGEIPVGWGDAYIPEEERPWVATIR